MFFGFSTSFKHKMFVTKSIADQPFSYVINTFENGSMDEIIILQVIKIQ